MEAKRFIWSRNFAAILVALIFLFTQVIPTIAENLGLVQTDSETPTVILTSVDTGTVESATALTDLNIMETVTANSEEVKDPESVTEPQTFQPPAPTPPYATTSQEMSIRIPDSVRVDPRSTSFFLPKVSFRNSNTLMLCGYASSARFDLSRLGSVESFDGADLKVAGDRTNRILIAGSAERVAELINGENGLKLFTDGTRISGQSITFRLVDISEPSLDSTLCDESSPENTVAVRVLPLGLIQVITKNQVPLEKGPRN